MSWLDRLRGGFKKTADTVGENLTGITKPRRSTPRPSTTSRRR